MKIAALVVAGFLLLQSCSLEDPTVGISTHEVLQWGWPAQTDLSVVASGVATHQIIVKLGDKTNPNQTITLTTDQGYFQGNSSSSTPKQITVKAAGKLASVVLVSDIKPNQFMGISAKVGDFRIDTTLNFTAAYPDILQLSADKLSIKADGLDYSTVSISLFRNTGSGKVSDNVRITLDKKIVSGTGDIAIPSFVVSSDEKATFQVRSSNQQAATITVTASITSSTGGTLKQVLTFILAP